MKKELKLLVNLVIFLVVISFAWFMVRSVNKDNTTKFWEKDHADDKFKSPYAPNGSFTLPENINRFDLHDDKLFVSAGQSVYVLNTQGEILISFPVETGARDIAIGGEEIFLLYPTHIAVYNSTDGQLLRQWDACSDLSDYCSFTVAGKSVFVTDADNKNICKYSIEGDLEGFINSPGGFIIPSYSFDVAVWNDTVFTSNSGRHLIESYTFDGNYINSFGVAGFEAGAFAGCCNPVFITFAPNGTLIASEKGNPRISRFTRCGKFLEILLNSRMLGVGGAHAREVRAADDKLFVTTRNLIMVFKQL